MVTLKDVAEKAGVSLTTASVAFTGSRPISSETRRRVLDAADRLGYEREAVESEGRNRARAKTGNIAYFVPSISNPFFAGFVHGMEQRFHRDFHNLILINTEGADDRRIESYMKMLMDGGVDGVVFTTTRRVGSIIHQECVKNQIPTVILFSPRHLPGVDLVSSDDEVGAFKATSYLIQQGFSKIVLLKVKDSNTHEYRLRGYIRALDSAGLRFNPELVIETVGHDDLASNAYTKIFLDREVPFDAAFCCNDLMAFGFMSALTERGLVVPEDISVIGADDTMARFMSPPLTTVRIETERLGFLAAELLLERIHGTAIHEAKSVNLPEELVVRESVNLKRG